MKKIMKIFKNPLFTFIIGGILFSSIIVIAESINSSEILYDNSNSVTSYDNVQDVLNEMYNIIEHNSTGFSLLMHSPTGLSTELIGGLYRYQGVPDANNNVDNYICFGTTNKSDCVGDTDKYMYRIIGINTSGQMKLIKKEALNTAYKWNSSTGVDWVHSDLYAGLNESYFLTNNTYVPDSSWGDRIVVSDWHYATFSDVNVSASTMANTELAAETVSAKIGLWYIHDYYYSLEGGRNCSSRDNAEICRKSWIYLLNNDTNPPNTNREFTISRYSTNTAWYVLIGGGGGGLDVIYNMTFAHSIRPVFYLRATETISSGNGTINDPYILS